MEEKGIVGIYTSSNLDVLHTFTVQDADESISNQKKVAEQEKWYNIIIQVSIPFFIAGIGTIGAGLIMADVTVQAIVCSCIVSVFAVAGSALVNGNFKWLHTLLLATASTLTATLSCLTLDMVLISIIMISHKMKLNPDNLATPMAASIGDVVSLATLSMWANFLYSIHDEYPWLMAGILAIYVFVLLPIWVIIVSNNKYTKMILLHGWTPVISALFISGSGGLILDLAVDEFKGYTVFQPIINGIGGNLVSVQASRISTLLHENSFKGVIPPQTKQWVAPWTALIKGVLPAKTARLLLLISIPGHAVFVYVADFIYNGVSTLTPVFILVYLLVGLVQLLLLLYVCHIMVHTIWKYRMDPDNSAIPYLTALGDLLGSTLLLAGFFFLRSIHQEYQPVG
nr:solute carrier family 41 member 1 isoform X2 [Leptinotarsa decemlineata]